MASNFIYVMLVQIINGNENSLTLQEMLDEASRSPGLEMNLTTEEIQRSKDAKTSGVINTISIANKCFSVSSGSHLMQKKNIM